MAGEVEKNGTPFSKLACQLEKFVRLWLAIGTLARLLARLHIKMRSWHAFGTSLVCLWHVDTFIGKLAHKNEKLTRLWHDFGMLARLLAR